MRACLHKVQQHDVRDVLVQGDVSREDDVVHMVGEARERLGGLDILVNNAGIQISQPSEQLRASSVINASASAHSSPKRTSVARGHDHASGLFASS